MDADRFDALTELLTDARSRRRLTRLLGGIAVGGPLAVLGLAEAAVAKKKKKKKKKGTSPTAPSPTISSPPPSPCPRGQTLCGGACVDLMTDAANCGRCGRRCQLRGICANGTCRCGSALSCPTDATCCAQGSQTWCYCAEPPHYWIHAGTCQGAGGDMGPIGSCPAGTTPCTGPRCRACCPSGSTCDPSTGTCLCDPAAGFPVTCRQLSQCPPESDYCANGTPRCGQDGYCLQPVGGGATRCGLVTPTHDGTMCGCSSHQECETRTGEPGAFCAQISGTSCSCPNPAAGGATTASTFCARPR